MSITLPSQKELFTGDLAVTGNWVVANLETGIPWPSKVVKVTFRGNALFLLPPTSTPPPGGETYPAVAVNLGPGKKFDDGMLVISHYLSSLAWIERHGARVEHWSGGSLPRPMGGRPRHPTYTQEFYQPYLPDTTEQRTRWALAFYREGLSLNHVAYQCLSFFKILNILRAPRVERIKTLAAIGPGDWPVLPRLSFQLAFHDAYGPVERMDACIIKIDKGIVWVMCSSEDGLTQLVLKLNFAEERLQAEIMNDLDTVDDGSSKSAHAAAEVGKFKLDYFKNGILEVWDADAGLLLGRCDAFLPVNVDMTRTTASLEAGIREAEEEAHRRESAKSGGGSPE